MSLRMNTKVKDDGATYGVIFNDEKVIHYKVAAAWVAKPWRGKTAGFQKDAIDSGRPDYR
jgi:hypothetical protein